MLFWQFSNIIIYIRVHGKMPDQHFKVSLFSNPVEKVPILVKSRVQICPLILTRNRTFSPGLENNDNLKCWSGIFPWTFIYINVVKLSNHHFNVWLFSNPGKKSGTDLGVKVNLIFSFFCTLSFVTIWVLSIFELCHSSSFITIWFFSTIVVL